MNIKQIILDDEKTVLKIIFEDRTEYNNFVDDLLTFQKTLIEDNGDFEMVTKIVTEIQTYFVTEADETYTLLTDNCLFALFNSFIDLLWRYPDSNTKQHEDFLYYMDMSCLHRAYMDAWCEILDKYARFSREHDVMMEYQELIRKKYLDNCEKANIQPDMEF